MIFKVFKPKLSQQEQGFTLVEVLVAILIATIFTVVAMQAIVIAAAFRVRARQFAQATTWIQEDLEAVKDQGAKFKYTSLTGAAAKNATSLNVATVDGFAQNDTLRVGSDSKSYIITNVDSNTNTLTITPSLGTDQPQDAVVEEATYTLLSAATASSITVASVNGFAVEDRVKIGSDTGVYRISNVIGNTLSIEPNLVTTQSQYAVVVETPYTSLTGSTAAGGSSINVASVSDFAVNDTLKVGSDNEAYTVSSISGNTLTITPNLATSQSSGAEVIATKSCNSRSIVAKFAEHLEDIARRNPPVTTKSFNLTAKEFRLTRTISPSTANEPYNVLKVTYDVSPTSGGSSVANFYTEVIPNAALQCP